MKRRILQVLNLMFLNFLFTLIISAQGGWLGAAAFFAAADLLDFLVADITVACLSEVRSRP